MKNEKFDNSKFDRLLSEIRNEHVDDKVVAQAGERAWKSIAQASLATEVSPHTLRSCEDFQVLIPGYLANRLAPARSLLFDDHVRACVACRHALDRARAGESQTVWRVEARRPSSRTHNGMSWGWAMGAAAVFAVAFGALAFRSGLLPGQHSVRAAVQTVDGSLYAGSGADMRLRHGR
jgi:hypothetical protein